MTDNNPNAPSVVPGMRAKLSILLLLALGLTSCRESSSQPPPTTATSASSAIAARPQTSASAAPTTSAAEDVSDHDPYAPAMTDEQLGALITSLSEQTGDFPSDNFVSNETSYLHVAEHVSDEDLRGKVYVGVGPEQNLTYVAMMRPSMAYIVDIRRQNMLEHLVLRALGEEARNRATFLARLTGRSFSSCLLPTPELASIDEIADALAEIEPSGERVDREVKRTLDLMKRLGVARKPNDEKGIRNVLEAFANKGLDLAYSMKGSGRRYPEVRKLLAMTDDDGRQRSYVADEDSFLHVQGLWRANRIVPVVGDFAGKRALRGIAEDVRERKLVLGVFYTSNVEQYLFEGGVYGEFVDNVRAFPTDDHSRFVRVWFDQGRAHPDQREGHRTTSVAMPVEAFLARHGEKPFRTYWHVMAFEGRP